MDEMDDQARADHESVSLGESGDLIQLPLLDGQVHRSQLGVFDPKLTIGPTNVDSEQFLSTLVMGDFSGGIGSEDIDEGSGVTRSYFALADTRSPKFSTLPPKVSLHEALGSSGAAWPLGDCCDTTGAIVGFVVQRGDTIAMWHEADGAWKASSGDSLSGHTPASKDTALFQGEGTQCYLWIPYGDNGYGKCYYDGTNLVLDLVAPVDDGFEGLIDDDPNDATQGSLAADGCPRAVSFVVDGSRLLCVSTDGYLWMTSEVPAYGTPGQPGATAALGWTRFLTASQRVAIETSRVRLDPGETPRHLLIYASESGKPVPYVLGSRRLWEFGIPDPVTYGYLAQTNIQFPPHPAFGLAATVFRPGEDLWISNGLQIIRFTSNNTIVPDVGPARDDALPYEYLGRIVDLQSELSGMYCLVRGQPSVGELTAIDDGSGDDTPYFPSVTAKNCLLVWTGTAWHGSWASDDGAAEPTWMGISAANDDAYYLWFGDHDGNIYRLKPSLDFHNARRGMLIGANQFADSGFVWTGWYDMNMGGFTKLAAGLDVNVQWATDTEVVEVYYQTEADGDQLDNLEMLRNLTADGNWHPLATLGEVGSGTHIITTPGSPHHFNFDLDNDGHNEGLAFDRIRFMFRYRRGADDDTVSPVLRHANLRYTVIPQNVAAFQFTVWLPPGTQSFRGLNGSQIFERVNDLIRSRQILKFVHQNRTYQVRVSSISGIQAPDPHDRGGQMTVSLIVIRDPDGGEIAIDGGEDA